MENKFLANNVIYIYIAILIIFPFIVSVGLICFQYWWEALFAFSISIIFTLIIFIFRKYFFCKILLNDKGISVVYHGSVIKHIDWFEVKIVKITYNNLFLLANFDATNENEIIKRPKDYISFYADKKNTIIFSKYYKFLNTSIQNPEKLGNHKDLFIK
ncbi:MAG: hypothetical protein J6C13_01235 [Clostridia bacterium]|nr:hypothetical protein [Clostridia bacterium]